MQAMQLQAQVHLHRRKFTHAEAQLQSALAAARTLQPRSPHNSTEQDKAPSLGGASSPADARSVASTFMEADEEARHAAGTSRH